MVNPPKLSNIPAQNTRQWLNAPIINLNTTDSTNNDAMRLIDADKAQPGTTIVAAHQTAGKGQRGRQWEERSGESLLMSMIAAPVAPVNDQFIFSAAIAVAIAGVLSRAITGHAQIKIKWPNDLIVNDKKAGGILIENILLGRSWKYAVIGLGLNLLQEHFNDSLPHATSLRIATGKELEKKALILKIREAVFDKISVPINNEDTIAAYNQWLFKKDEPQVFVKEDQIWTGIIRKVLPDGRLEVQLADGRISHYTHGEIIWKY